LGLTWLLAGLSMTRIGLNLWLTAVVCTVGMLSGCGDDEGSSSSGAASSASATGVITRGGTTTTTDTSSSSASTVAATGSADSSSSANAVTLSWEPPQLNADGTPLVDLKGYKVHFGAAPDTYSDTITLDNAGLATYVVQNLAKGKYYFAVTAYNSKGAESALSPEVATQVD
jgi:hypothetical protein